MKTAFPICQVDGSQFNDVSALKVLLNGQTSGRYIISKGRGWHGGIHFNNRIAFWAQHFQPVQAMADGELVAYRMAEEYPTTQYLETTSSYSNNFCLLRHTFQNPDKEDESYTFYSLYMHLQSQKEIQDSITAAESVSEIHYIRLTQTWYVRGDVTTTDFETKTLMPVGTVIQLTDPSRTSVTKKKAGTKFWDFLKCKVVQVGKFADNERDRVSKQSAADQKLDQEIWLSVSKYNGDTAEYCLPALADVLTKQMPPWHTKNGPENNLPIVADGTVQVPELPMNIKAGEHLGYLGKYEYLKNAQGNIDQEYRVHLEVFSNDRPPEYFLKALAGGQEEHGFQVIDGSSSTGVMEPANAFFNDIRRAIDTDNDGQISENELVAFYQAATNRLEKVIAKHPSEWYSKEDELAIKYKKLIEKGREIQENKLRSYYQSEEGYQNSPYPEMIESIYSQFINHEQQRIEKITWIQQIDLNVLNVESRVWHIWPLSISNIKDGERHWHEPILNPMSTNHYQSGGKCIYWGLFGDDIRKERAGAHRGLDIFAEVGTNVYACVDAEIQHTRHSNSNGNLIVLRVTDKKLVQRIWNERLDYKVHELSDRSEGAIGKDVNIDNGLRFAYMHLKSIENNPETGMPLKVGDKVTKGQIIAKSGVSGTKIDGTCAPHLHFEVSTRHQYFDSHTKINPGYFVDFKYYEQQSDSEKKWQLDVSKTRYKGHIGDKKFPEDGFNG
ncbi:M23 family metallopeptidase [Photobacterium sp. WH77]|uniref:M23 family metallopeptidase n=1 Tax=unclassified Photobacterium TaxID=2628852 RepID=UPI001EDC7445|nr:MULTISPECIES: M23 family metallopeptidase [unclassified Photobacterium]MCG2838989.1 M23 family metallopeptidase [Photobacterium sp. WH77]MCG2846606.1 M23 family metallopeptidase [Photobacterium sp. WH80]